MEFIRAILENGTEKDVNSIFYSYNGMYYLIYTDKEIDENGYVILNVCKVGKNQGSADNEYIGVEISDSNEWSIVQKSVAAIVEDKKNNTNSGVVTYYSTSQIGKIRILGKKTFRLMKDILKNFFGVSFDEENVSLPGVQLEVPSTPELVSPVVEQTATDTLVVPPTVETSAVELPQDSPVEEDQAFSDDVIVDFRTAFYDEQEKNRELENKITELTKKLEEIKNIIG